MNIGFKLIIEYRVEVNFLQVDVQEHRKWRKDNRKSLYWQTLEKSRRNTVWIIKNKLGPFRNVALNSSHSSFSLDFSLPVHENNLQAHIPSNEYISEEKYCNKLGSTRLFLLVKNGLEKGHEWMGSIKALTWSFSTEERG